MKFVLDAWCRQVHVGGSGAGCDNGGRQDGYDPSWIFQCGYPPPQMFIRPPLTFHCVENHFRSMFCKVETGPARTASEA